MAVFVAPNGAPFNLRAELERLRGVVADMEALARGEPPGRADLAAAPTLDGWCLDTRATHCLTGVVAGHPALRTGRIVRTSDLWILAPSLGYARTLSRIYRLGHPLDCDARRN